jgi:septal ring factor EnvC (AmiA/AmiB activator)
VWHVPVEEVHPASHGSSEECNMDLDKMKRVSSVLDQYSSLVANAQSRGTAAQGEHLNQVRALVEQMKKAHAELMVEGEKHNREIAEKMEAAKKKMEEGLAKMDAAVAAAKDKAAQAAAKKAARAQKKIKPIDPGLGEKLKNKLLEEFGLRGGPLPPPQAADEKPWA